MSRGLAAFLFLVTLTLTSSGCGAVTSTSRALAAFRQLPLDEQVRVLTAVLERDVDVSIHF